MNFHLRNATFLVPQYSKIPISPVGTSRSVIKMYFSVGLYVPDMLDEHSATWPRNLGPQDTPAFQSWQSDQDKHQIKMSAHNTGRFLARIIYSYIGKVTTHEGNTQITFQGWTLCRLQ